jgi:hypothetical protein
MPAPEARSLQNLGFVDVGVWFDDGPRIGLRLGGPDAGTNGELLMRPRALYAFVQGAKVLYIGKTARTIQQRFVGYSRPGKQQQTNLRCHANIRAGFAEGLVTRVLIFAPTSDLSHHGIRVDLAAGLEDALIAQFDPPWNGGRKGGRISEEAEREEAEETAAIDALPEAPVATEGSGRPQLHALATFTIRLGKTYYRQGFINVDVSASPHLGEDGERIRIMFDDGSPSVDSMINRTANPNGTVRVVGGNRRIADWFQGHFSMGEVVEGRVLANDQILLLCNRGQRDPTDPS